MENKKIKELSELGDIVNRLKKEGKRIVHCHGCFDILHIGHIKHFLAAKQLGDILIVSITPDHFVHKGPGRPFFNEETRLQTIASIECVDYVTLNKWETAVETIKILKPDFYVKGKEVLDNSNSDVIEKDNSKISNLRAEEEAVNYVGGKMHLTEEVTFSSSRIINQINDKLSPDAKVFLSDFKKKYSSEEIISLVESLKGIKVLIIGDAVLDEYTYCSHMEKSGKEPIVTYKFSSTDLQAGGIFAIANQVANFTPNVSIVTCMGRNAHYELLKSKLKKEIEFKIVVQKESETLIKKRYIDDYKRTKMFEIYTTDEVPLGDENEKEVLNYLKINIEKFDIILVADFGHGMITQKILNYISQNSNFLAINCQLNGSNFGYNFVTKYPRADFISINERELRLTTQEKKSDIKISISKIASAMNAKRINITRGRLGDVYYNENEFYPVPAFNREPLDTVGAGDCVLALVSLLAYKNVNPEIAPFLVNCIGSMAVNIINNRNPVSKTELNKFIKYILK